MNNDAVSKMSLAFAIRCVNLRKFLVKEFQEYDMSKQLLRSGTAVGALVRESKNAESKADFIHKLSIAQKECDESLYWLELLFATDYLKKVEFDSLTADATALLKIIKSSILTTKQNMRK
jgi:four helix bundle protein